MSISRNYFNFRRCQMTIQRCPHDKQNPYVMLNKQALNDAELSWGARGLWAYLMQLPDNWKIQVSHLCKLYLGKGGGERAIYSLLNELILHGYCERRQINTEKGFSTVDYLISEFKKSLPHRSQADARDADARESATNNKEELIKNKNKDICADVVDAPLPKKIQRRENVFTSDEDHLKLQKKYGKDLVEQAYDHLREWKLSKKEAEPKSVDKHTDYYRIIKWVVKSLQEGDTKKKINESIEWEKENRDLFFLLKQKHPQQLKFCEYTNGFVLNKNSGKDVSVKMCPKLFKPLLANVLGGEING